MTLHACSREQEVRASLRAGHWPEGCGEELRAHVQSCRRCDDLVLVALTVRMLQSEFEKAAPVFSPGLLWWRAQLRRRHVAVEWTAKPLRAMNRSGSTASTSTPEASTPASSAASRSAAGTGPASDSSIAPPGNAGWPE